MADFGNDRSKATARAGPPAQRLDKWLWFSRVLKSRTQAAQIILDGRVRVNRARITKPSQPVSPGDVLTIALRGKVQILKVTATGHRRGPPAEARQLYEIVEAPEPGSPLHPQAVVARRPPGAGRPSKKDRRLTDQLTGQERRR
ncbi:MAG: RNA-binding S4 domain-containing protein [Hyphomonadaceae bacterium]|nr:RNA-binding S4 domain-containing protein [Hyphomonadaceae bacterium]